VGAGQLPEMLGLTAPDRQTLPKFLQTAQALPRLHWADVALSLGVIVIVLAGRMISKKAPGALIAIIIAIVVSRAADLAAHGVAVLGQVPRGLPHLAAPALGRHDAAVLLGTSTAMFVVILAQSAVTARTYAAAHEEAFSQDADLVGLGAANVAAAFSGTFVVNGSPTQTQVTDSAGGRSQLASLTAVAVVLAVLLLFTGTLTELPIAALASVVFVIAVRLIDVTGMRRILAYSRPEFAVALLTTVSVVVMGVEDGIVVAVVISIINHLRHSYRPLNSVLLKSPTGHWKAVPVRPGARTEDGLVIYRFGTSLYYANASRLVDDITVLAGAGGPLRWLVLDFAAIGDVDYTAAGVLTRVTELLRQREVRFLVSSVLGPVRNELNRYGINAALGPGAYYETPGEALEAFHATRPPRA
jgi:SulP family sulfate permease